MLSELQQLLAGTSEDSTPELYGNAIIENNLLGKPTTSTRTLSRQRLAELYALDRRVALFRILRRLWSIDEPGRPLLAVLCALARDPLLRATANPVLTTTIGEDLSRQYLKDAIRGAVGNRLNESILDKVVRNASSSWTQSGHLSGRSRKIRQQVSPTPPSTSYALVLGYLQGLRGHRLFQSLWAMVLDSTTDALVAKAADAKRLGLLDMKHAGDVIEISFPTLLTEEERQLAHGTD